MQVASGRPCNQPTSFNRLWHPRALEAKTGKVPAVEVDLEEQGNLYGDQLGKNLSKV